MKLKYAYKTLPRAGETRCGDAVLAHVADGRALFVVLDALGHGAEASRVAQLGMWALSRLPSGIDAARALVELQDVLRGTRGAAATCLSLSDLEAQVLGIGNVACRTLAAPMPFVPRPGIVGSSRRLPEPVRLVLLPGQRLVLHSDGVSHRFDLRKIAAMTPEEACGYILHQHRHAHDDASVLVIDAGVPAEAAL